MNKKILTECKMKLLSKKQEIMNSMVESRRDLLEVAPADESDVAQMIQNQNRSISRRELQLQTVHEIEYALARIEEGTFGICEETGEPIETARLLALPWTRTSIEGAEIREKSQKRFAA